METLTDRMATIEHTERTVRAAAQPATKAEWINDRLGPVREHFDFAGVNLTPESVLQEFREKSGAEYDKNLLGTLTSLEHDLAQLERDADLNIALAEDIPSDPALGSATDQVRLLADIAITLKRAEAERRLTGKTTREVVSLYQTSGDTELARVIEEQQRGGWRDVSLAKDEDVSAILQLKQVVDTRRRARAAERAADAVDVKARIAAIKKSAVRDTIGRFVKHGPGLGLSVISR